MLVWCDILSLYFPKYPNVIDWDFFIFLVVDLKTHVVLVKRKKSSGFILKSEHRYRSVDRRNHVGNFISIAHLENDKIWKWSTRLLSSYIVEQIISSVWVPEVRQNVEQNSYFSGDLGNFRSLNTRNLVKKWSQYFNTELFASNKANIFLQKFWYCYPEAYDILL